MAFIDVGGKGEATIDVAELKDADGDIEVSVGDRLQAVVVSTSGGLTLSRKLARGAANAAADEDAFHSGPSGRRAGREGGQGRLRSAIAGQRAFCPFSQIDNTSAPTLRMHEGKVYTFRISEYKEGGRNLVVSRRALLEEERRAAAAGGEKSIVAGAVAEGARRIGA